VNEADFIAAIRQHWINNGANLTTGGATPVVATQKWEDDEEATNPPAPYHRFIARSADTVGVAVGRSRSENRGLITIEIFTPAQDGPGPGERLGAAVTKVWRAFRNPRVKLMDPGLAGLPRQGAFNRQLVTVGWRADLRPATA
jgi:hypothetical protein